jgi:3-oxoacyl-[acyl-carrier protein] reductase
MDFGIRDRVALVCGASQGLGRASAEALAAEGATVAVVSRRPDAIQQAATEIASAHGVPTMGLAVDLVEPGACERAVASTLERFGRLDILVANAGGPPPGYVDAIDDETWRRAFELTFLTTIRLARAALPHFVERGWGRLVVIGSGSMAAPIPNLATSSGIRPGLRAVIKLFAERHAKDGVTANVVAPGYVRTERLVEIGNANREESGHGTMQLFRRLAAEIPLGRLGEPEEVGALVAFLASERAAYITGQLILVDGGRDRGL